jgi:hypothetical protein
LVQLAKKGTEEAAVPVPSSAPVPLRETAGPMDEFTRLRMDLLANFRGQSGVGQGIPALVTCTGCNRSFYSEGEREKHFRLTPACQEWVRRGLVWKQEMDVPFFPFLEQGLATLLGPTLKTCRFCQKPLANRRAQEKHLSQAPLCNRLAHDTFQSWFRTASSPVPASLVPVLALPAPSE